MSTADQKDEKASVDEIAAAVMSCALPMTIVERVEYSSGERTFDAIGVHAVYEGRLDDRQRSRLYAVDVTTLTAALASLEFRRPTEDETVLALERPAQRLRAHLLRLLDCCDDNWYSRRIELLDAYLAGLRLREPESLASRLQDFAQRNEEEGEST